MSNLETSAPDRWQLLRQLTDARIALGRAGTSLPTQPQLNFQWAHARARDAVHHTMDVASVQAALETLSLEVFILGSAALDRRTYLRRPDLGRALSEASRQMLCTRAADRTTQADLAIVIADGLSALAIERNAPRLMKTLLPALRHQSITLAPICLVQQARVAIGDEIGEVLGAKMVAIFIGERPGLSSPDSMGIYLSWQPKVGLRDSARNCLSNIRAQGMSDHVAVEKLIFLLTQAMQRKLTGVALKDETVAGPNKNLRHAQGFIL